MEKKRISPVASLNKAMAQSSAAQIAKMSEVRHFTPAEFAAMKVVHAGDEGSSHLKVFRDLRTQLMKQTDWLSLIHI